MSLGGRSARYLMQSLGEWGREAAPNFWVERWKVAVQHRFNPLIVADDHPLRCWLTPSPLTSPSATTPTSINSKQQLTTF